MSAQGARGGRARSFSVMEPGQSRRGSTLIVPVAPIVDGDGTHVQSIVPTLGGQGLPRAGSTGEGPAKRKWSFAGDASFTGGSVERRGSMSLASPVASMTDDGMRRSGLNQSKAVSPGRSVVRFADNANAGGPGVDLGRASQPFMGMESSGDVAALGRRGTISGPSGGMGSIGSSGGYTANENSRRSVMKKSKAPGGSVGSGTSGDGVRYLRVKKMGKFTHAASVHGGPDRLAGNADEEDDVIIPLSAGGRPLITSARWNVDSTTASAMNAATGAQGSSASASKGVRQRVRAADAAARAAARNSVRVIPKSKRVRTHPYGSPRAPAPRQEVDAKSLRYWFTHNSLRGADGDVDDAGASQFERRKMRDGLVSARALPAHKVRGGKWKKHGAGKATKEEQDDVTVSSGYVMRTKKLKSARDTQEERHQARQVAIPGDPRWDANIVATSLDGLFDTGHIHPVPMGGGEVLRGSERDALSVERPDDLSERQGTIVGVCKRTDFADGRRPGSRSAAFKVVYEQEGPLGTLEDGTKLVQHTVRPQKVSMSRERGGSTPGSARRSKFVVKDINLTAKGDPLFSSVPSSSYVSAYHQATDGSPSVKRVRPRYRPAHTAKLGPRSRIRTPHQGRIVVGATMRLGGTAPLLPEAAYGITARHVCDAVAAYGDMQQAARELTLAEGQQLADEYMVSSHKSHASSSGRVDSKGHTLQSRSTLLASADGIVDPKLVANNLGYSGNVVATEHAFTSMGPDGAPVPGASDSVKDRLGTQLLRSIHAPREAHVPIVADVAGVTALDPDPEFLSDKEEEARTFVFLHSAPTTARNVREANEAILDAAEQYTIAAERPRNQNGERLDGGNEKELAMRKGQMEALCRVEALVAASEQDYIRRDRHQPVPLDKGVLWSNTVAHPEGTRYTVQNTKSLKGVMLNSYEVAAHLGLRGVERADAIRKLQTQYKEAKSVGANVAGEGALGVVEMGFWRTVNALKENGCMNPPSGLNATTDGVARRPEDVPVLDLSKVPLMGSGRHTASSSRNPDSFRVSSWRDPTALVKNKMDASVRAPANPEKRAVEASGFSRIADYGQIGVQDRQMRHARSAAAATRMAKSAQAHEQRAADRMVREKARQVARIEAKRAAKRTYARAQDNL